MVEDDDGNRVERMEFYEFLDKWEWYFAYQISECFTEEKPVDPEDRGKGCPICQVEISKKEVSKGILGGRVALQARSQSFKVKDGLVTG